MTGCSGVANLRLSPQVFSKGVPPSLDAPQSSSLLRSLSRSLLMPHRCNPSGCQYMYIFGGYTKYHPAAMFAFHCL